MTLDQLEPGSSALILDVDAEPALRTRIEAMGLRVGRQIQVVRRARGGGPLQVRVGMTDLIIRPVQARMIYVAAAPEPPETPA
jgi:ferrous iron transport protein A